MDLGHFKGFRKAVSVLLDNMEAVHAVLPEEPELEEQPGWRELKGRPLAYLDEGRKPYLVATLYGPTGAGKSTLFSLLTGLEVPAGGKRRPTTYNVMVASPPELATRAQVQSIFPLYSPLPLAEPEQLADGSYEGDALFFKAYESGEIEGGVDLLLADVPDFDSFKASNWEKAEALMQRADVVIFVVYPEAYLNEQVVVQLEKCCRRAGKLAYIFQKVDFPEQPIANWQDLVTKVKTAEEFKRFRETRRSDGRTLADFLEKVPVYYSPRSEEPDLFSIEPLCSVNTPELTSLLTGYDAAAILFESLKENSRLGVETCRRLCLQAQGLEADLAADVATGNGAIEESAGKVAGTEFPLGRMLELVISVSRESTPAVLRFLTAPVSGVARLFAQATKAFKEFFNQGQHQEKFTSLQELERERLGEAVEELITRWRADLKLKRLKAESCRLAAENYLTRPPVSPGVAWEAGVREGVRQWTRENRGRLVAVASLKDVLLLIGGGAVALDLAVTGGGGALFGNLVLGHLGLLGAAGSGSVVTSFILKYFQDHQLEKVLARADADWRKMRTKEIAADLKERFAGPLFLHRLEKQLAALRAAPVKACLEACDELDALVGFERVEA